MLLDGKHIVFFIMLNHVKSGWISIFCWFNLHHLWVKSGAGAIRMGHHALLARLRLPNHWSGDPGDLKPQKMGGFGGMTMMSYSDLVEFNRTSYVYNRF